MQNLIKKTEIILITLVFVLSGTITSTASITDLSNETTTTLETIDTVVYRYGISDITPVPIKLKIKKDATSEEKEQALVDICENLAKNDQNIQQYINDSQTNTSIISHITSRGRGFHSEYKIRFPVKRHFKKYPNFPPYNRIQNIPVITCKYSLDNRAYSTVTPLSNGNTTQYTGPHSLVAVGFLGYTTWIGPIAKRGFILRCGFSGYAIVSIS
jgi:hypothetical protein